MRGLTSGPGRSTPEKIARSLQQDGSTLRPGSDRGVRREPSRSTATTTRIDRGAEVEAGEGRNLGHAQIVCRRGRCCGGPSRTRSCGAAADYVELGIRKLTDDLFSLLCFAGQPLLIVEVPAGACLPGFAFCQCLSWGPTTGPRVCNVLILKPVANLFGTPLSREAVH